MKQERFGSLDKSPLELFLTPSKDLLSEPLARLRKSRNWEKELKPEDVIGQRHLTPRKTSIADRSFSIDPKIAC
ncbi:hypothetical protein PORCRE_952 [Porphyromonas crevioricanis JCM 15906]|uniref:Uncharacterized protein n=1 Tax=Porphyromonas crevioricanis JCM 15906 TaxID=1305617 RepID=T1CN90_9PORP|nr:hypothetical protein [Porphyromonas crevioricanis]GAD05252.1 hypothetical protein PORCRE_952 [Porphyromonas crevioricanis JCM 15906]SKA01833.1 hypothetical protein SAMN02745203_01610 [Porphyromonas crevioricanis]